MLYYVEIYIDMEVKIHSFHGRLLEGEVAASLLSLSQTRSQTSSNTDVGKAGSEAEEGTSGNLAAHVEKYVFIVHVCIK